MHSNISQHQNKGSFSYSCWRLAKLICQIIVCGEAIKPRTEDGTEVIDAQYGRGRWTRGQKRALIGTVCLSVRTLISRSVAATKTGQAPAESHVKRMKLLR